MQKASKLIVVNAAPYETRVATLESGILVELLIERGEDRNSVGNIYNGKVIRVLPGMQAAFVDIGMDKAGFLFAGDFVTPQLEFDTDAAESPSCPRTSASAPHGTRRTISSRPSRGSSARASISWSRS